MMRALRIHVLLTLSIFLTISSGVLSYYAAIESRKRVDWVLHSYKVLAHSSALLSKLTAAESDLRAYMITWDSSFLYHYNQFVSIHDSLLTKLETLTADNPEQLQAVALDIRPYIKYKTEQMGFVSTMARTHGLDSAVRYSYANRSKLSIDNLRRANASFTTREEEILAERLLNMDDALHRQRMIRYLSLLLIGVTLVAAYKTITTREKRNSELMTELAATNKALDQRVQERTHELDRKNVMLSELNHQLQHSMEEVQSFYESLQIRNHKAEFMLQEVRDLYNNAPCGYHSLDEHGTFVRINETELSWLGYTRDEVIDKLNFKNILAPTSLHLFKRIYPEFMKKGVANNVEFELTRKNGETFPVILNSVAIYDDSGRFVMGRTTVFDISARKELETQLIRVNDALLKLNDEKDHFLGIAAHDLKSPINSILGLLHILKLEAPLSSEQSRYLELIEQSCISMQRLISNLLDINRIEQGLQKLAHEKIELKNLLKKQQMVFADAAARKNIRLKFSEFQHETDFYSDSDALHRILENLISNALKFSPAQTEVSVHAGLVDSVLRLEVRDQGPGIPEEDIPKLFGKFQKLSARPTAGESSSGLGLSIVKELIELLEGKITVESNVPCGAAFIAEVPIKING